MRTLIRTLLLSLPLVSFTATPSARALSTIGSYDVLMDSLNVGRMSFRSRVYDDGSGHCVYTGAWTGPSGPLTLTKKCMLLESHAGDNFDCEENQRTFFNTVVTNDCNSCFGFDEFGQVTNITTLIAGESPSGHLYGIVISAAIGDVEGLEIALRTPAMSTVAPTQAIVRGQALLRPAARYLTP